MQNIKEEIAQRMEIINTTDDEKINIFKSLSEPQLKHFFEPNGGLFIAESEMIISRALESGKIPYAWLIDSDLFSEYEQLFEHYPESSVYVGEKQVLNQITGFNLARGIACAMLRPREVAFEEILSKKTIAIIEDVMNPTNVGAIFRSAAALGIEAVILTSGSSDPLYRRAVRVSMGTVFSIPWIYLDDAAFEIGATCYHGAQLVHHLKKYGFSVLGMALSDRSVPIDFPNIKKLDKKAIILGTESTGIKDETLAACDYVVKIPMMNNVDSLNVAAASAVAFWELCKQL